MGLDVVICVDDIPNANLTQKVSSVEVYEKIDQNSTFKLSFAVDACDGDMAFLIDADTAPSKILTVLAKDNDNLICLVKGPVLRQQTQLKHGGAGSSVNVEGEDIGITLDSTPVFQETDEVMDSAIASDIISSGNQMVPDVEDTPHAVHKEENHIHIQRESNLSLLRSLARRNGFHFWITFTEEGIATGHFRSRSLDGDPSSTLIVNQDNYNIDQLQINSESNRPSRTIGMQVDLRTLEIMGGETTLEDTVLGSSRLSELHGSNQQTIQLSPTVADIGEFTSRSRAALREAQWFINAYCQTSLHRLVQIVRFHTVVQIQGAGSRHSGKYYVTGVKHKIDAADYVMDLELQRNGWGN